MSEELPRKKDAPRGTETIGGITAIEESRSMEIRQRQDIEKFVEAPLLTAAETLWDKNIRTLASSANAKDVASGEAYLIIDFDTLSAENQDIARRYTAPIDFDGAQAVKIVFPVSSETTAAEIATAAMNVASAFVSQPAVWVKRRTFDEMKRIYRIPTGDTRFRPEDFTEGADGMYWDTESQLFYPSKELFQKATQK